MWKLLKHTVNIRQVLGKWDQAGYVVLLLLYILVD